MELLFKEQMSISQCEAFILDCMIKHPEEHTIDEVCKLVQDEFGKNWGKRPVATFLARLSKRKYLKKKHTIHSFTYSALIGREQFIAEMKEQQKHRLAESGVYTAEERARIKEKIDSL